MTLAVLPDFREEGWLSMEYCAERLLAELPEAHRQCPPYRRVATRFSRNRKAINADRVVNRYWLYPRFAKRIRTRFDFFHIVDHSYSHLAKSLPGDRTGIYCHDIDAFRGVVEPAKHSAWFRKLGAHLLGGLRSAAVVFVNSTQTRDHLTQHRLIEDTKIVDAPLGVADEFTTLDDGTHPAVLEELSGQPWILHVGSCVPRKRIDVLLDVLARTRRTVSGLKLLKASGEFSPMQQAQIDSLGLRDAIVHVSGLSRGELAALYRSAPLVVIPSEAEGFGLPALEAVACGAKVLASDIPALREAGGVAARYAPVATIDEWASMVHDAFESPSVWPSPELRTAHAATFTWARHAATIRATYERLA